MGVDENIERFEVADRRIRPPCGVADQLLGFRAEELVLSDRGVSTRMVAQAHGPFVGVSGSGKDLCGDHPGLAGIDFSEPVEQGDAEAGLAVEESGLADGEVDAGGGVVCRIGEETGDHGSREIGRQGVEIGTEIS